MHFPRKSLAFAVAGSIVAAGLFVVPVQAGEELSNQPLDELAAALADAPSAPPTLPRTRALPPSVTVGQAQTFTGFTASAGDGLLVLTVKGAVVDSDYAVSVTDLAGFVPGSAELYVVDVTGSELVAWDGHTVAAPLDAEWTFAAGDRIVVVGTPATTVDAMSARVSVTPFVDNFPALVDVPAGSGSLTPSDPHIPFFGVHYDAYRIPVPVGRQLLVNVTGVNGFAVDAFVLTADGDAVTGVPNSAGMAQYTVAAGDSLIVLPAGDAEFGDYRIRVASPADAPKSLTATPIVAGNAGNLRIQWVAGDYLGYDNTMPAATRYRLSLNATYGGTWIELPASTTSRDVYVYGDPVGVELSGHAGGYPGAGWLPPVSTSATVNPTPLAAVSNVRASLARDTVQLQWTAPTPTGASSAARYLVTWDGRSDVTVFEGSTWLSGVDPYVDHSVSIRAVDPAGNIGAVASMSWPAGGLLYKPTAPLAPTVHAGDKQAYVDWSESGINRAGRDYIVTAVASPGGAKCTVNVSGTSSFQKSDCWIKGLTNGKTYRVTVTATGPNGVVLATGDAGTVKPFGKRYQVAATRKGSGFDVEISPKQPAGGLKYTVQRKSGRKWVTVTKSKTSTSSSYFKAMNLGSVRGLKPGTYRVVVPAQKGLKGATSNTIVM